MQAPGGTVQVSKQACERALGVMWHAVVVGEACAQVQLLSNMTSMFGCASVGLGSGRYNQAWVALQILQNARPHLLYVSTASCFICQSVVLNEYEDSLLVTQGLCLRPLAHNGSTAYDHFDRVCPQYCHRPLQVTHQAVTPRAVAPCWNTAV